MATKVKKTKTPELNCNTCQGQCCKYFALQIDTPESPEDFDHLRWYIAHKQVAIFIEENDWYLQVNTPCAYLTKTFSCGMYETRPQICRDYGWDPKGEVDCHENDKPCDHDHFFSNLEELERYLKKHKIKWASQKK